MTGVHRPTVRSLAAAVMAGACLIAVTPRLSDVMASKSVEEQLGAIPQGRLFGAALGEFRWIAGESYALQAISYFGGRIKHEGTSRLRPAEERDVLRVLRASTQLNPYHEDTYYFAQGAMSWDADTAEDVNDILRETMRARTWDYLPPLFIAFNYSFFMKKPAEAAPYFRRAGELSGNPIFLSLAARQLHEGGETEMGIMFLDTMISKTTDPGLQRILTARRDSLAAVKLIEDAVKAYRAATGTLPQDIRALVTRGFLASIPADPRGEQFHITKDGKVVTRPARKARTS